eukprot:s819_g27.t1
MPPLYKISVKNSFLEFMPMELCNTQFRRTLSCPCLSFVDDAPKSETEGKTISSEYLPDVSSSLSTDSDVKTEKLGQGTLEKLQSAALQNEKNPSAPADPGGSRAGKNRSSQAALAMQMRLNKDLMEANLSSKPDIFKLVENQLHRMNAVNLATAIHRIARLVGPRDDTSHTLVLNALLDAIQKRTWREIEDHDDSMPAKCATIIAWSCATLQVFRQDLLVALIQVVESGLKTCNEFEVTNVLWACAQYVKAITCTHRASIPSTTNRCSRGCLAAQVVQPLRALMGAVEVYFQGRLHQVKGQILVSALVSTATLSAVENVSSTSLFKSICDVLALKSGELSFNNKTQIGVACHIMSKYNKRVVRAASKSFSEKCPQLAAHFRG